MFTKIFQITSFSSLISLLITPITEAQIIPNGLGTTVNSPNCTTCTITGGTTAGTNLFHSFEQFSIPTGGEAFFDNATNIQNIISRITGGFISNIDGLITANGSANLFLINPNGFIFGENSSLNIGGSFMATTAESIKFADGTEFSATNANPNPILTVTVPIGLQFGSQSQGSIQVNQSSLEVGENQTLALVGGAINTETAYIFSKSGRIELGSVQGNNFVGITQTNPGWILSYDQVNNFQDINLTESTLLETSGDPGGEFQLQGRQIKLTEGSALYAYTESEDGGNMVINASERIESSGIDASGLSGGFFTDTFGEGKAGNILINARQLIIQDGAKAQSYSSGEGRTGDLIVNVNDSIELSGADINKEDVVLVSGLVVRNEGDGDAGQLIINTDNLTVKEGANVGSISFANGNGGDISINAKNILLTGESAFNTGASGIFANAINGGTGKAGNITINSQKLIVEQGAQINLGNFQSRGQTDPGLGGAGNLIINSPFILLNTGGTLTAEANAGDEGNIILNTSDLRLRNGSLITTNAKGSATGGNITINTDTLVALENSDITANAVDNFGGRVIISSQAIFGTEFRLQLTPESDITASSDLGPLFSGSVEISTPEVDPNSGLVELPGNVVDVEGLIAQNACNVNAVGSSFIVTGKGGLPANPNEPLSDETPVLDWVSAIGSENAQMTFSEPSNSLSSSRQIVQATGWIIHEDGTVALVGSQPVTKSQSGCGIN